MTRFMLLDRGEELSKANCQEVRSASSPVRLKLLEPAPPFREGEVVQVAPFRARPARSRDFLLCREGGGFFLRALRDGQARDAEEALGRVVAVELGGTTFSLESGLLASLPVTWLSRGIDALEVLGKFRRPFTPSLYLGSAATCLAGVREKYDCEAEARHYSGLTLAGLEPFERETIERYVKPGGRLLDIGCGGGREALGLARAGFRVVGIDIAPRMIEAARANAEREGLQITFRIQSVTELEEPPGSFDGAYWAGSYPHIPGRVLRVETLRRIMRALTAEGVLILVAHYRQKEYFLSRSRLVDFFRRVGARLGSAWPLSEPGDGYMRQVSDASDPREACFFHEFSGPQEVRAELEAAGVAAEEVAPGWWICRRAFP